MGQGAAIGTEGESEFLEKKERIDKPSNLKISTYS